MAIGKWNPFAGPSQTPSVPPPQLPSPAIPAITPPDAKRFGFENFGNTCYANSVLQALYFCGPFRDLVVQYPDPSALDIPPPSVTHPLVPQQSRPKQSRKFSTSDSTPYSSNSPPQPNPPPPIPPAPPTLISALRSLYVHISNNPADKGTVAPRAFIDKIKDLNELFRTSQHQDAHEFLNFLLNKIVEDIEDDRRNGRPTSSLNNVNLPLDLSPSQIPTTNPQPIPPSGQAILNGNPLSRPIPTGPSSATIASSSHLGDDMSRSIGTLQSNLVPSTAPTSVVAPSFTSTLVHRLFEGVLTSETRCLTCETVSSRDESFLDLSIDIEQNSSVTACLRQFSASEMLCQKNKFFCDSCCDLQEAEKRMKIKKLPNVLALHLKRFKYQEDVGRYIKLAYRVAFPFELRLFNTVDDSDDPDRLYELFAVVVHIGNGPHHGHYVSIIKARGDWLLFDDDNVDIIKESDISRYYGDSNSGAAYVLYYQATDLDVAALGVRPPVDSPPVPTIISEADPTSSTTPLQPVLAEAVSPAMPPGLTEEPESIVVHELPPPVTPILSTTGDSPFTRSSPGHSDTKLHIPHSSPESHPSSPITPATPSASTSTFGNFFHSLRHTPSRSVRINGGLKDIPPPLPPKHLNSHDPSSHADHSQPPSLLPNLSVPVSMPNGKEREPGNHHHLHKASTWFRRKSVRAEKEKAEDKSSSSVAPSYTSTSIAERSLSLGKEKDEGRTPWFRNATRLGRRASEAEFHDPAHTSSLPHFHFSLSTPSSPFTHSHPTRTSMSSGISPPASPSIYPVPEHKKSTPDLPSTANKHMKLPERPSTAGASTGGGKRKPRPKSAANVPPLPPLPPPKDVNGTASRPKPREGRPTSPQEHRHTVHGGDTAEDHHQQQQPRHQPGPTQIHLDQQWLSEAEDKIPVVSNGNVGVSGKNRPSAELWSHPESESSHAAPILGTENSNGTSSSLSTTGGTTGGGIGRGSVSGSRTVSRSGSGMGEYHPPPPSPHHPKKKASRKLSFTAPMLGFGIKKDKDKGKEEKSHQKEHKDKRETYGNPHPPTGTASFFT